MSPTKPLARSFPAALIALAIVAASGTVCSCASSVQKDAMGAKAAPKAIAMPSVTETAPKNYPGIHNAVTYHEGFVSGSVPEGEEGFDTLATMGIKTIISVDGAEPEIDKAKAHGIRYIHLPIGYNGFNEQRKLELVRATRDAMKDGPVYIHCHHGKHRSASAAACIAASMGWQTPEAAVERMKVSGTAPNYKGLFAAAKGSSVLGAEIVDAVPASFPEISKPSGFVHSMVEMDEVLDHLKVIEKASWAAPQDHPDLVPVAEAGRLADLFRAANATNYSSRKPEEFVTMMTDAHVKSQTLEDLLAANTIDPAKASAQFKLVAASCKDCHAKFRD